MTELKKTDVFVPSDSATGYLADKWDGSLWKPTTYIQLLPSRYVLDEPLLNELLDKAFEAGRQYEYEVNNMMKVKAPDKEQFIKSILK